MNASFKTTALTAICLVTVAASSFAIPLQWNSGNGGNNHYYEMVIFNSTWLEAKAAAESAGGYLVTITSAAENLWITNNVLTTVDSSLHTWIGLYQPSGSPEPAGGWSWITGEAFSYSNWYIGEPNNFFGNESYGHFEGNSNAADGRRWNDIRNNPQNITSYVVEYNSVPDGDVSLLLASFFAFMLVGSRRRRVGWQF